MTIHCFATKSESCEALAAKICNVSREALKKRPFFSLVLSGGSTPRHLYRLLASSRWRNKVEWHRAQVFFGDERCVPSDHPDSNYKMAREAMLDELPIPDYHIHRIHGERQADVEAVRYQAVVEAYFAKVVPDDPLFDLTLLGVGSDGHTASLFPGDEALFYQGLVTPVDPPAALVPAVKRVSLALACIGMSKNICFLVDGAAKARIVSAILADGADTYPAAMVQKKTSSWFLSGMDCSQFANQR